jgi:hypothetical protein
MENFNQGRRKDQYESSAKAISYGCLGFAGIIIISLIISVIS